MVILITKLGVWTETSHQAAVEFCSRLEESFLKQRKRELKWDVSDRGWTEGGVQQRTKEVLWVIQSYSSWIQEQKYAGSKWNRTSFKRDFFSLLIYSYTHTHLLQQLTSNRLLTRTNDPISLLHSEPGDDVVQLISWLMYWGVREKRKKDGRSLHRSIQTRFFKSSSDSDVRGLYVRNRLFSLFSLSPVKQKQPQSHAQSQKYVDSHISSVSRH